MFGIEEEKPKFKIKDWVRPIGSPDGIKMQIISTIIESCYAATQMHYWVRIYKAEGSFRTRKDVWFPTNKDLVRFSEIELTEYVEPKEEEKKDE